MYNWHDNIQTYVRHRMGLAEVREHQLSGRGVGIASVQATITAAGQGHAVTSIELTEMLKHAAAADRVSELAEELRVLRRWDERQRAEFVEADEPVTIVVRDDLAAVGDEAVAALAADPAAGLYVRGGRLVRVVADPGSERAGLTRPAGAPVIQLVPLDGLRDAMARSARWMRHGAQGKELAALPPDWAARNVIARGQWPF